MEKAQAIRIFESFSSGVRLDIYRLLVRESPEGLVAGQIGAALGLASNKASFHLKEMTYAGLLTVTAEGRFQRYRAQLALVQDLITFLTAECCAGHPDRCLIVPSPSLRETRMTSEEHEPMNILFLCTGNSCRSVLAEATFRHLAPPNFQVMSAGSRPTGFVHPRALALLKQEGIVTRGLYSKSWDALPLVPDIVITLCASAAGETCPAYMGPALRAHWGVDDPAQATGSEAEIQGAFQDAYRIIRWRIETFLALPWEELTQNRGRLQAALDHIGERGA